MIEKRNRNGGRGRDRGEEPDEDLGPSAAGDEATALKEPEAPARKPTVAPAPPAETAPSRRQGGGTRLFLLLVVIALAALLYRYWGFWQGAPATQAASPAPPVTVSKPLVKEMEEWSDFTGQFEARESVEVRARVSGYLESVNFTDGQLVKKGDLLFVIEPRPFELALETSKAQLAQTEAKLQLAQQQLDRTAQLRKNDYATKETYDERVSQVAIAAASRDAALAAVNQAQLNLHYTRVSPSLTTQYARPPGTIRLRAPFANPNLFIPPGQFGRVRVPMSQLRPTILVPDAAVVTDQSVKLLFTVGPDGTVVPKPVELGPV